MVCKVWGSNSGRRKSFLYLKNVQTSSGTHPASYSVGTRVFPGVKQAGHEVNDLPPSSSKIENEWSYTSTPPIYLHGVDRENFTFNCLSQLDQLVAIYKVMFRHNVGRYH